MFQRIEARGYRCLRKVEQSINPFEILVGSNASGKSTFLDVIAFLGTLVSTGLEAAVEERTTNFHDLVWRRDADRFELAVEASIPDGHRVKSAPVHSCADTIRYEVVLRLDTLTEKLHIATSGSPFSTSTQGGSPVSKPSVGEAYSSSLARSTCTHLAGSSPIETTRPLT
jgi:predicted ATPase